MRRNYIIASLNVFIYAGLYDSCLVCTTRRAPALFSVCIRDHTSKKTERNSLFRTELSRARRMNVSFA